VPGAGYSSHPAPALGVWHIPMLHLVSGDDQTAARATVAKLRADHEAHDPSKLNMASLDGDRVSVGEIIAACDSFALFGGGRYVEVRGFLARFLAAPEGARGRRKAADFDALLPLAKYLPHLPESTVLVFWEGGPLNLAPLPTAIRDALLAGTAHVANLPPATDRSAWLQWVRERARREGVDITRQGAEALLVTLGPAATGAAGVLRLGSEIAKLATYALDDGGTITPAHVALLVTGEADEQAFAWLDAVIAGNAREAVRRTEGLLAAGEEPMRLLALLSSQVGYLLRAKRLPNATDNAVASALGVAPGRAYHLLRAARAADVGRLAAATRDLAATDEATKTGVARNDADALRWAVLQIARLGPPGPAWERRDDLP